MYCPELQPGESLQAAVLKGVAKEEPSHLTQLSKKGTVSLGKLSQLEFSGRKTSEERAAQGEL